MGETKVSFMGGASFRPPQEARGGVSMRALIITLSLSHSHPHPPTLLSLSPPLLSSFALAVLLKGDQDGEIETG